jgi:hypothetical protein
VNRMLAPVRFTNRENSPATRRSYEHATAPRLTPLAHGP